jgi:putative transposase
LSVNRQAQSIEIDFSLPRARVVRALEHIIGWRGKPMAIRCNDSPEYLSEAITQWAMTRGIAPNYIQPGKPQQNTYVERCNLTVRYEWLRSTTGMTLHMCSTSQSKGCGNTIASVLTWAVVA